MLKLAGIMLCVMAFLSTVPVAKADDLYGSKGIAPEAVRQGRLGSCYFHAVIAAMAERRPETIRKMIQSNADGSYTVTFGDGKKETAYAEDLRYTHESGYDLSDGEWVAVLFRSYAQKVLRESLLQDSRFKASAAVSLGGSRKSQIAKQGHIGFVLNRIVRLIAAASDDFVGYGNDAKALCVQVLYQLLAMGVVLGCNIQHFPFDFHVRRKAHDLLHRTLADQKMLLLVVLHNDGHAPPLKVKGDFVYLVIISLNLRSSPT